MPEITAIVASRVGRVSIFLDGEFALGTHEEVVAALGLCPGRQMEAADLQSLVRAETRRRAKESALRLLGYRGRSRMELRRRLESKGYEEVVIDDVLEDLARAQLLDDREFTESWVTARTGDRPLGPQRIAWELRQKGVAAELIESTLAERCSPEAELSLALTAAGPMLRRIRGAEPEATRRKLAAALRRRGFSWSVTAAVLEQLLPGEAAE